MVALSKILYPNSGSVLFDEDLNVASIQGLDGAIGSLVIMAWNQITKLGSQEMRQTLNFLQVVQVMDMHKQSKNCSLDSVLSSLSSNTPPAYPSNTPPKRPTLTTICT